MYIQLVPSSRVRAAHGGRSRSAQHCTTRATAAARTLTPQPSPPSPQTPPNQVHAHEGHIITQDDGSFLWYGTGQKRLVNNPEWLSDSIHLYTSRDLSSWRNKGRVFLASSIPELSVPPPYRCVLLALLLSVLGFRSGPKHSTATESSAHLSTPDASHHHAPMSSVAQQHHRSPDARAGSSASRPSTTPSAASTSSSSPSAPSTSR